VSRSRQLFIPLTLFASIAAAPASAVEFETHRVQGLLNLDLSYGATYRLDDADERLIAFANGGDGPNVNGDDGELNYNAGLVSNMVRGTAELIVAFENVGLYVRGAAFHDWVQRFFRGERLFDLDDLPGAVDGAVGRAGADGLAELQAAFVVSPWATRTPIGVEVPFDMVIGGASNTIVRGRIDAVFADADGGATVVDWKTGEPPDTPHARQQVAVQLAVYRLAWAALRGCPPSSVRAVFHYVRSGQTVRPDRLPDVEELAALLPAPAA